MELRAGLRLGQRLREEAEELPTVNQIEPHPYLQQAELRARYVEYAAATEAWSPLAQGAVLDDETIGAVASLDRGGRIGPDPSTFVSP